MQKNNPKKRLPGKEKPGSIPVVKPEPSGLRIPPWVWLLVVPVALYARILWFDFTALDDKFFVVEHADFNEDPANIVKSFSRGLFLPENDTYYRPIFLVDMILESQLFGKSPMGFHLFSLLFHVASVFLLFFFFKALKINELPALILTLLFAVHPVLSQTVAWIPGRNDQILMIFTLSGLLFLLWYFETRKILYLCLHSLAFMLALLTKETAVMIPLLSFVILMTLFRKSGRQLLILTPLWVMLLVIWYRLRASSHPVFEDMVVQQMLASGIERIPAYLQYLGKIVFPFNLSAVPQFEQIPLWWGIAALAGMVALVVISKCYRQPLFILGLIWYIVFLLPVLIVPKTLNDQVYEHRLYIPFAGILLILSQTILFQRAWNRKIFLVAATLILVGYSTVTLLRLGCYQNIEIFWRCATEDSPESSFAWLNRGIQSKDPATREQFIRKAYSLNPREMLVNYWMGINSERKNLTDSAAFYYRKEFAYSNFPDLYINFSKVLFDLKKYDSAAYYLDEALKLDPENSKVPKVLSGIYFRLAESSWNRKRFDSAAYYLEQVLRLDPENREAQQNLEMVRKIR
jgi:hypothetical protein